jgi:uncharacterized protein (TIRG00374 family)
MGESFRGTLGRGLGLAALLAILAAVGLTMYGGGVSQVLGAIRTLPVSFVALATLGVALEWALDTVRYRVAGRAVGVSLGWWAWFEIALITLFAGYVANIGIPVAAFALARRGVPPGEALAVTVGKNLLFFPAALGPAWVLLFGSTERVGGAVLYTSVTVLALGAVLQLVSMLAVALWPAHAERLLERIPLVRRFKSIRGFVAGMSRFFRGQPLLLLASLVTALLNQAAIVVTIGALFQGFGGNALAPGILARCYLFSTLSQVSPTPGGAGLGEAGGVLLFQKLLPDAKIAAFVGVSRFACAVLPILAGGALLARALRSPSNQGEARS